MTDDLDRSLERIRDLIDAADRTPLGDMDKLLDRMTREVTRAMTAAAAAKSCRLAENMLRARTGEG